MLPKQDCKYTTNFTICKFYLKKDFSTSFEMTEKHYLCGRNSGKNIAICVANGDVLVLTASDIGQ